LRARQNTYPAGIKVSDAEMDAVNLTRHAFQGAGARLTRFLA
jgi:hypothetical protein